jgi:beta-glucuronidase
MNKRKWTMGAALAVLANGALMAAPKYQQDQGSHPAQAAGHRETLSLTGDWGFRSDQNREGDARGWGDWKYFTGTWRQVPVPITFDNCAPGMQGFRGVCWFQKKFQVPAAWQGRRVGLRFEGVNNLAKVWVNGQLAGENTAFSLPFEFSVDGLLRYGQDNLVVVRASSDNGALPPVWYWRPDCGILRDVNLVVSAPCRIAHVRIVAEPAASGGSFSLRAFVENQGQGAVEGTVAVTLVDRDKRPVAAFTSEPMQLATGRVTEVTVSGVAPAIKHWSPESPALYTAQIELRAKDGVIDRLPTRFGFRKIEVRGTDLLLNGKKIFLTGFNRHEDSPKTGMALDRKTTRWDLTEMKKIGANFLRMPCYPHDPSEYDLCDELGILVMGESPLNTWSGQGGEATVNQCQDYMKRMVERDFNHPCIILWSVSNECAERDDRIIAHIQALVAHTKTLDPTRPVTHVNMFWAPNYGDVVQKAFAGDDIVSINEYFSELRLGSRTETYDYAQIGKSLGADLDRLHTLLPNKPILITECGHTSIQGCDGPQGEEAQAKGMEADLSSQTMSYLCGTTIWCWAKHPWQRGAGYGPCIFDESPYGVVSRDRSYKHQGFYAVKEWFPKLQQIHTGNADDRPPDPPTDK